MTKPFRFEELLARIRLRLRSASDMATANDVALKVGDIVLDLRTRRAHVGSLSVDLPAREFTLAETFFFAIRGRCLVVSSY